MQFGPGIIQEHDLLTSQECAQISEKIISLESYWEPRLGPYQFATLGCAAYLDAGKAGESLAGTAYADKSRALNPILKETFADIYERVRLYFCGLLQDEAYYDEAYSYPGFHLFKFEGNEIAQDNPSERAHFDYQFAQIFPDFAKSLTMPITFTLPIQDPSSGSSLEMWDLRPEGHAEIDYEHIPFARTHPSKNLPYTVGRIFSHDGLNLHAMGRIPIGTVGRRMTLQGHVFKTEKGWLLYW
jgi:hypothetical protein